MKRLLLLCGLAALFAVPSASALQSMTVSPSTPKYGNTVTFGYHDNAKNTLYIHLMCNTPTASVLDVTQLANIGFSLTGWDGAAAACQAVLFYYVGPTIDGFTDSHLVAYTQFGVTPT